MIIAGAAPWSRGTNRNARRNRRSVVNAADLHPRHCFRSEAPSSKTNDSRPDLPAGYGLIHEFRANFAPWRGVVHSAVHEAGASVELQRPASRPPSRTGRPASSISTGLPSPTCQRVADRRSRRTVRPLGERPVRCRSRPRRPATRPGAGRRVPPGDRRRADRRALDEQGVVRRERPADDVPDARRRRDVVAVERPVGLGVEASSRPSARASSRWLNRPSGSVSSSRAWTTSAPRATTSRQRRPLRPSATVQVTTVPSAAPPPPARRGSVRS